MTVDACCEVMAGQLTLQCPDHPDLAECPDAIVVRSVAGQFRFPVRDGGTSFWPVLFCPWCGTRLHPDEDSRRIARRIQTAPR